MYILIYCVHFLPSARPNPFTSNSPRLRSQGPTPPQGPKDKDRSKAYAHVRLRSETGEERPPKSKAAPPERVQLDRYVSKDGNVKPKRQAPPPPKKTGGSSSEERAEETPPPAYATVVKSHRKPQSSDVSKSLFLFPVCDSLFSVHV